MATVGLAVVLKVILGCVADELRLLPTVQKRSLWERPTKQVLEKHAFLQQIVAKLCISTNLNEAADLKVILVAD